MTKHIALALVLVAACKGKDTASKDKAPEPAATPTPAAPKAVDPAEAPAAAPAPPSAAAPALLSYGRGTKSVQCAGFTSSGAYLLTVSMDNALDYVELEALGNAEDPKLSWNEPEDMRGDDAKVAAATAPLIVKMNAFVADKKLTPCAPFAGKLGGKDAKVTAKDQTVTLTVGGKTITRNVEAGGDVSVDSTFTTPDASALVVGVEVTAEAMSKHLGVYFGPDDLK